MRTLIRAAQGTRLAVPVALAAVTGLRRGELLALRWRNVRLEKQGSLYITEALEQTREFGIRFKPPEGEIATSDTAVARSRRHPIGSQKRTRNREGPKRRRNPMRTTISYSVTQTERHGHPTLSVNSLA